MITRTKLLNSLCRALYKKDYKGFVAERDIKKQQLDKLFKYLEVNKNTEYGRQHGFADIKCYEDYCEKVPITVYEDYEPYIERMKNGEKNIFTSEDILLFELTSGSSGGKKYIPYTATLKKEFQKGIHPWLYDLYTNIEGITSGKSYWSITPVTSSKEYTKAGISVGFEEDAEYFGLIEQHIMKQVFAVDSATVKFVKDMDQFYHDTAIGLLKSKNVSLISVWNPTFLSILWDYIEANKQSLEAESGFLIDELKNNIKLISCWADGSAAYQVKDIYERFPKATIQPKGILATEGFISFPLCGEDGSRLSIDSHFFEFINTTTGDICMADALTEGEYELLLTTGGGFYRYRIGDVIQVLKVYKNHPPIIRFLRRSGISTDLCGEKLTEEFVRNTCINAGLDDDFCLLAPAKNHYILFTTNNDISGEAFDSLLRESYHYNYCRDLNQLECVKVIRVSSEARNQYLSRLTDEGMRLGDIKVSYLSKLSDWEKYLKPF